MGGRRWEEGLGSRGYIPDLMTSHVQCLVFLHAAWGIIKGGLGGVFDPEGTYSGKIQGKGGDGTKR